MIGMWVQLLKLPYNILFPLIILFTIIGVYCSSNNVFDVYVMIAFGVIGYFMRKLGYEPAPLVLAFVLGPMLENNLRKSLILSQGDLMTFVQRPISAVCLRVRGCAARRRRCCRRCARSAKWSRWMKGCSSAASHALAGRGRGEGSLRDRWSNDRPVALARAHALRPRKRGEVNSGRLCSARDTLNTPCFISPRSQNSPAMMASASSVTGSRMCSSGACCEQPG